MSEGSSFDVLKNLYNTASTPAPIQSSSFDPFGMPSSGSGMGGTYGTTGMSAGHGSYGMGGGHMGSGMTGGGMQGYGGMG